MGDETQFSDDISSLWGPYDTGLLEPAPARPVDPPDHVPRGNGNRNGTGDRVKAVEARVRTLAALVEALRTDVLAQAVAEERLGDLDRRVAELENDLVQGVARLEATLAAREPGPAAEPDEGRVAEAEARLHRRLDQLTARVTSAGELADRLAAMERKTALLAESVEAYRRDTEREPELDAVRADIQAAAAEIGARTDDHLTQRFHELVGHLSHAIGLDRLPAVEHEMAVPADGFAVLVQRIMRLTELLESHRVQSVMGWELESLRGELIGAVSAQLAELRSQLAAVTDTHADSTADAERRRLEASWQQSMPGF